jgi:NADH:ubiquinone oxidoreductase subunit 4 (subunit M)
MNNNNKSSHILNTSSSLLGFTFLILTSIKGFGLPHDGFADEVVSLSVVLFALSCFFSFISMLVKSESKSKKYELIGDYIFLSGLLVLIIISILLATDVLVFKK